SFKQLIEFANHSDTRRQWKGQVVEVTAEFQATANDRTFDLVRMKITCCSGDAVPVFVRVLASEPITSFRRGDWVRVKGRVDFVESRAGSFRTILRGVRAKDVTPTNPDLSSPYVQ